MRLPWRLSKKPMKPFAKSSMTVYTMSVWISGEIPLWGELCEFAPRAEEGDSMQPPKGITIYDIAKEAGVSPATVSRVLTNSPGVRPEKRERVRELIAKYNFTPNVMAKSLSETRRHMVGMMCSDVRNPYYASLFIECERAAYEKGYTLMLNNTFTREELEITFLEKMHEQRPDAIILAGGVVDWIQWPPAFEQTVSRIAARTPVVVAGRVGSPHCYQVAIDHAEGMRLAVAHLASLGHVRIAYLCCAPHISLSVEKREAFYRSMGAQGLPVYPEYVVEGENFDEQTGFIGMNRLMGLEEKPTAVIAINDLTAAGALQAIVRLGYSVPGDFSLFSFDNSFITDLMTPSISGIEYHYDRYGQLLIDIALDAINGKNPPMLTMVTPSLVIKGSCRKNNFG